MHKSALAIAAHPDDIEFLMAGTLLLLRQQGWEIHCFNVSSGSLGSMEWKPKKTRRVRAEEARAAAKLMGAHWHAPVADDLEITYSTELLRAVSAVVREAAPSVILTHSLTDYMEDHTAAARLAVTAAFARGFPAWRTEPGRKPVQGDVTVYHAMPHMLVDPMGFPVVPEMWVDTAAVMSLKRAALACHESQKEWLDRTQGMDSYLQSMEEMASLVAAPSGKLRFAEGWRRHMHAGFCAPDADPLMDALGRLCVKNPRYRRKG